MDLIFKSLTREEIAYEILPSNAYLGMGFYKCPGKHLHERCVEFQTYGDGLTQHSHSTLTTSDHFLDALASLAKYLFDHPDAIEDVRKLWPEGYHAREEVIKFFSSLKYNEEKAQWYNEHTLKISTNQKKAYDRRWETVPSWADGSVEATFRFMTLSHFNALQRFSLYKKIRELNNWQSIEGHGIGSTEKLGDLIYAFESVNLLVEANRKMDSARSSFACLENNWISRQNKKEEEKEEEKEEVEIS